MSNAEYVLVNKNTLLAAVNALRCTGQNDLAGTVEKDTSEVSIYCKPEPVSPEALEVGMRFCCGKEENLIQELAALRNVVQSGMNAKCKPVFNSWNYHFPNDQKEFKE